MEKLFDSAPLPYKFVKIPKEDEPEIERDNRLAVYVNKVITDLSKDAFKHSGFDVTENKCRFNASWGRQYPIIQYSSFAGWQKINHFCGANLMGRKDRLHQRMEELRSRVGEFADFYPRSFLLPQQKRDLEAVWKDTRLWIVKPSASSRGRGIHVVSSENTDVTDEEAVVQTYIDNPMLITGRKFDLRFYVLVTSSSPLKVYMHDSGLVRFATHKYDPNAPPEDAHVHLTNFSLNKEDDNFIRAEGTEEKVEDSKWSIPFFIKYLKENNYDVDAIFKDIERVTVATIIAGFNAIRSHHANYVKHRQNTYELYGIDVMLDQNFKAHVIEINISPGMSGRDSPLDFAIKNRLMHDVLRMARIIDCDANLRDPCPGIKEVEYECNHSVSKDRIKNVEMHKEKPWENPTFSDIMNVRDFVDEKQLLGGFRRVFPKRDTVDSFVQCFDRMKYDDIVFIDWIKMNKEERLAAVKKNFQQYTEKLEEIRKELGLETDAPKQEEAEDEM